MARLLVAMFLVPVSLALAAEKAAPPGDDPMAGWVPPKLENPAKDKKEIQALMNSWEAAAKRGDIEAAAALVDFPVLMATDDSKGDGMAETWERERWIEVMKPFYSKPNPDMKVTHKPTIFLLSDSLASLHDVATVKMGAKTLTMRNSTLLIRRDGKWLVKAMAEPGWGDMPEVQGAAAAGSAPSSEGTGSGAQGSGSGMQGTGSGAQGTGSGAQGTGSGAQGTGSGAQGTGSGAQGTGTGGAQEPPASGATK